MMMSKDCTKRYVFVCVFLLLFLLLSTTYQFITKHPLVLHHIRPLLSILEDEHESHHLHSNVTERLMERKSRLEKYCKLNHEQIRQDARRLMANRLYTKYVDSQKRVVIDQLGKLGMCLQAKGGSSFWKYLFLHRDYNNGITLRKNKGSLGLEYINMKDFQERGEQLTLSGHTLYVFGRNPWERLVSLYRQKIESSRPDSKEYRYVMAACANKPVEPFVNLLKCVISTWKVGVPDRHWEPLTTRCRLCDVPYHYIGKLEHMNDEASEVYRLAGISGDIKSFFDAIRKASMRPVESAHVSYKDYYKNVPEAVLQQISDVYKHDLDLLGYPSRP